MILYNSLGQTKQEFIPHTPGKVNMYTCGPTVYHYAHIGNLRTYIMEDVLEKYLRFAGYDVNRVMNITDVGHLSSDADTGEDKMLKGAKREHKTVMEIAQFYTDAFFADCEKLNIKRPDVVEPATNCIDEFIDMISVLLEKGYAYLAGGNVYFDTSKLSTYYVFGNMNEEDLAVGVRDSVEEDENKRNKTDFVLWFTKSKFDCGGVDNAFPHHTNEIAQSEAYLGHPWCKYWFHVLHLNDARGKMSKSKGDFLTVSLLESKGYDPVVYRMFCLQSHYRKPLTFSYESLDNCVKAYDKLIKRIASLGKDGEPEQDKADALIAKFKEAMDNDLNTSLGLTVVYDVLKADANDATKRFVLGELDKVLSLDLLKEKEEAPKEADAADAEIEALIAKRTDARKNKDWATADAIRDRLAAMHIVVVDTKDGISWHRE